MTFPALYSAKVRLRLQKIIRVQPSAAVSISSCLLKSDVEDPEGIEAAPDWTTAGIIVAK
jgi:hypothetical protein